MKRFNHDKAMGFAAQLVAIRNKADTDAEATLQSVWDEAKALGWDDDAAHQAQLMVEEIADGIRTASQISADTVELADALSRMGSDDDDGDDRSEGDNQPGPDPAGERHPLHDKVERMSEIA